MWYFVFHIFMYLYYILLYCSHACVSRKSIENFRLKLSAISWLKHHFRKHYTRGVISKQICFFPYKNVCVCACVRVNVCWLLKNVDKHGSSLRNPQWFQCEWFHHYRLTLVDNVTIETNTKTLIQKKNWQKSKNDALCWCVLDSIFVLSTTPAHIRV